MCRRQILFNSLDNTVPYRAGYLDSLIERVCVYYTIHSHCIDFIKLQWQIMFLELKGISFIKKKYSMYRVVVIEEKVISSPIMVDFVLFYCCHQASTQNVILVTIVYLIKTRNNEIILYLFIFLVLLIPLMTWPNLLVGSSILTITNGSWDITHRLLL